MSHVSVFILSHRSRFVTCVSWVDWIGDDRKEESSSCGLWELVSELHQPKADTCTGFGLPCFQGHGELECM